MIHRINNEYNIDGTPCKKLIDEAVRRGWAKRGITSVIIEVEKEHVPVPEPKCVQPVTLEDRARGAGMTVDQYLEMRMKNKEGMSGN